MKHQKIRSLALAPSSLFMHIERSYKAAGNFYTKLFADIKDPVGQTSDKRQNHPQNICCNRPLKAISKPSRHAAVDDANHPPSKAIDTPRPLRPPNLHTHTPIAIPTFFQKPDGRRTKP